MSENNYLKFGGILLLFCVVAAGLLAGVNALTAGKIKAQAQNEEEESLGSVYPGIKDFTSKVLDGKNYYEARDSSGNLVGYVIKASRRGYSSQIVSLVGIDQDGVIRGIKILSMNETPGLGSKINEVKQESTIWDLLSGKNKGSARKTPWFLQGFIGKDATSLENEVQAITGATISSSALILSVQEEAKVFLESVKNEK